MKTKLQITQKILINAKNVIGEKRLRTIFHLRIRIQKYQIPIVYLNNSIFEDRNDSFQRVIF